MQRYGHRRFTIDTLPDNSSQVYVMKGTNEVFTDYEKYLKRYVFMTNINYRMTD